MLRHWCCLVACVVMITMPVLGQPGQSEELFVPILINGVVNPTRHYQTLFRFVELSGTTASPAVAVDIEVFDNDGNRILGDQLFCPPPVPSADLALRVELAGSGSQHFGTKGFVQAYDPAVGLVDGWTRLTISGPGQLLATAEILEVGAFPTGCPPVICSRPSNLYRSDAIVQTVKPANAFQAAAVITPYRHTAFAVVNPSAGETAHVFVQLFEGNGEELQRGFAASIPPMHRRSAFAWEWATLPPEVVGIPFIPPIPDNFYGSAKIVSDIPVVVGTLQVLLPEGKLAAAEVASAP